MTQNRKIAITGGIGSGKSAFSRILRDRGLPVFSCDEINAELFHDEGYLAALALRFPDCVKGGVPDKAALSARVFSDPAARAALEAIAHPVIMRRLSERMSAFPVSFAEVPLLYEGGFEGMFDAVIALRRDAEARLRAVRERDGLSEEEILRRMSRQIDARSLGERDCILIENIGDLSELKEKALAALAEIARRFPETKKILLGTR